MISLPIWVGGGNTYVFEYTEQEAVTQDQYDAIRSVFANNGIVIVKGNRITIPVGVFVADDILFLEAFMEGSLLAWMIHYDLSVKYEQIDLYALIIDLQARVNALESK